MQFEGHTLKRIRLCNPPKFLYQVSNGGWIESEDNLSHKGDCFVTQEAKVFGNARVMDDALISDYAIVKDNALVKNSTCVANNAIVGADTIVSDFSWIMGNSKVFFYSSGSLEYTSSNISGSSSIDGNTVIEATGFIFNSEISSESLFGHLKIQ